MTNGVPTYAMPLAFVLGITAIKDALEDYARHKADDEENDRVTKCFDRGSNSFVDTKWSRVKVGDIIRLQNRDLVPADMAMISSSVENGLLYSMTANLDGETNLKLRKVNEEAALDTSTKISSLNSECGKLYGYIDCQSPNGDINNYDASLVKTTPNGEVLGEDSKIALGRENMLLRGCQLRNTNWAVGIILATGKDTKIQMNFAEPPFKVSTTMKTLNYIVLTLFGFMIVICGISSAMSAMWLGNEQIQESKYLWGAPFVKIDVIEETIWRFFTFVLLFAQFVPISLYVTLDVVKFVQAMIISYDLRMYNEDTDTAAIVKSLDLTEDLGTIGHIFSDKTGTLTKNEMDFMKCSVGGVSYGLGVTEVGKNVLLRQGLPIPAVPMADLDHPQIKNVNFVDPTIWDALSDKAHPNHENLQTFFLSLALNHEVMPEYPNPDDPSVVVYSATSPDEGALVSAARYFGYFFYQRKMKEVNILVNKKKENYKIVHTLGFSSKRKRSSVIVEHEDGRLILYSKGADNVILERLRKPLNREEKQRTTKTMAQLEKFAADGLRTLLVGVKEIERSFFEEWSANFDEAKASLIDRTEKMERLMNEVEQNLELIGATGVEDRLQDKVPDTLRSLRVAGIHVWVLTGDKVETAVNIGHASSLLTSDMPLMYLTADDSSNRRPDKEQVGKKLEETLTKINELYDSDYAIVLDTKMLKFVFAYELTPLLFSLADKATSVICARVSPSQKADIVRTMRQLHPKIVTLAIGDGANDVPMIQAAHVGIGISGNEGLQAVNASDFAIARFKYLKPLLLVHGRYNIRRVGNLGPYMFYKNILQALPQFFFGFDNIFSGQNFYYELLYQAYNVVHTGITIMVYGAIDKDVTPETALKYPSMYQEGPRGAFFSTRSVFWWMCESVLHSLVCYYVCYFAFKTTVFASGEDTSMWYFGTIMHFLIVLTANARILMMTRDFTWLVFVSHFLCFVGWVFFLWFFCAPFWDEPSMFSIFNKLFGSFSSYVIIILGVGINIFISFLPTAFRVVVHPYPSMVCAEREGRKGLIYPDDGSLEEGAQLQLPGEKKKKRIKRSKSATEKRSAKEHIVQMVMTLFRHYDEDRSDSVGPSELKSILIDGGAAGGHDLFEEELETFVHEITGTSDMEISKFQFSSYATDIALKSTVQMQNYRRKGRLHDAFATVLTNAKDKLESRVLELQQIFEFYDSNSRGEINRDQFGNMLTDITAEDVNGDGVEVTAEDVELFVKALDADGDNMIGQTEFIDYMLRGMAMTPDERSKFARRSQMHAKLNRFVENILWRLDAEEL
jgi:phospholipid-translocating P-type ATPase (flippase)